MEIHPAPIVAEKPLTQAQIKNLEKLVEGDFADLMEQVTAEIDNRLTKRLQVIADKYGDGKLVQEMKEALIKLQRNTEDSFRKLETKYQTHGIIHNSGRYGDPLFKIELDLESLEVKGQTEAVNKAEAAAQRLKRTASRVIRQRQRQVNREVLLQGIGVGSALELVADLPDALSIIEQVKLEMAASNEDDIKELIL